MLNQTKSARRRITFKTIGRKEGDVESDSDMSAVEVDNEMLNMYIHQL